MAVDPPSVIAATHPRLGREPIVDFLKLNGDQNIQQINGTKKKLEFAPKTNLDDVRLCSEEAAKAYAGTAKHKN